jgi:tRNA 2-selenouridine synthase
MSDDEAVKKRAGSEAVDVNQLKELGIEYLKPRYSVDVEEFEKKRINNELIILDARSEGEFDDFHIVGAYNVALLNNDARKIVGTIYKQKSQSEAIDAGWEYFSNKADQLVLKADEIIKKRENKDKEIIVYCARGGMRSGIVTNLLAHLGYKVFRLTGGLKSYKNYLTLLIDKEADEFEGRYVVLEGKTGTGKTAVIEKSNLPKINLEDLAQHRSSSYGGVNLTPRSQKMFSFLLYEELRKFRNEKYIVIEGESRRIGNLFIHEKVFKHMLNGIFILIKADIDNRVQNILDEYFADEKSVEQIIALTPRLTKYIGRKKVDWLIDLFKRGENREAVKFLLEGYYDKSYKNLNQSGIYKTTIFTDNIESAVKELENFVKSLSL